MSSGPLSGPIAGPIAQASAGDDEVVSGGGGGGPVSGILLETGTDYLLTEAGDYLVQES